MASDVSMPAQPINPETLDAMSVEPREAPLGAETAQRDPPCTCGTAAPDRRVAPSGCGCGCSGKTPPQLVYALGMLGYDFGTESRRDSIVEHMEQPANPYDATQILGYLDSHPWDAPSLIWTLNLEATPIYAIRADGPFAGDV